jgi:hypothetical protein
MHDWEKKFLEVHNRETSILENRREVIGQQQEYDSYFDQLQEMQRGLLEPNQRIHLELY